MCIIVLSLFCKNTLSIATFPGLQFWTDTVHYGDNRCGSGSRSCLFKFHLQLGGREKAARGVSKRATYIMALPAEESIQFPL